MKMFEFEIKELLSRIVEAKAKSVDEAFQIVKEMYQKEYTILDSFSYLDEIIKKKVNIDNEYKKDALISEIVDYLYQDEEKHYEEWEKPSDHIFLKLKKVKELIACGIIKK